MSKSVVAYAILAFGVYLAATGRLANIITIVTNGTVKESYPTKPNTAPLGGGSSGGGGGGAGGGF